MKRRYVGLESVICPKCQKKGYLYASFLRRDSWRFSGFAVVHCRHDPIVYRKLRDEGLSVAEARKSSKRVKSHSCWVGKETLKIERD